MNYRTIAITGLIAVIVIRLISWLLTYIELQGNVGLYEANPISSFIFSNYGFTIDAAIGIVVPLFLYFFLTRSAKRFGLPQWFPAVVFIVLALTLTVDMGNDLMYGLRYGVI